MRPTLRQAASKLIVVMKVSVTFLKNADKSSESKENDAAAETKEDNGDNETDESAVKTEDKEKGKSFCIVNNYG